MRTIYISGDKQPLCEGWNEPSHVCSQLNCPTETAKASFAMWGWTLDDHCVVDIDSPDAHAYFAKFIDDLKDKTMIIRTPGKHNTPGYHLYFRGQYKSFTVGENPRHLDFKSGPGHMVVAPNQTRRDGGKYEYYSSIAAPTHLNEHQEFLAALLKYREKYRTATTNTEYNQKQLYFGKSSGRNDFFLRLSSSLRTRGIPHDYIDQLCHQLYEDKEFMDTTDFPPQELALILKRSRKVREEAE